MALGCIVHMHLYFLVSLTAEVAAAVDVEPLVDYLQLFEDGEHGCRDFRRFRGRRLVDFA